MTNSGKPIASLALAILVSVSSLACSPEVGSEAWCEKMRETPSGDWTAREAADYAGHCLFK